MEKKRPFTDLEWHLTPEPVRHYILYLEQALADMAGRVSVLENHIQDNEKRLEKLEVRAKKNSRNSSKPPSSDSPFNRSGRKKKGKKSKRPKGGQKGHKAHRQQMLTPTESHVLMPERCRCGNTDLSTSRMEPFYTHQHIELPEIRLQVSHFVLHRCHCPRCGKTVKAVLPEPAR
jgi:transposase